MIDTTKKCKHFNGLINDECKIGIKYDDIKGPVEVHRLYPCLGECDTCKDCSTYTEQEKADQEAKYKRATDAIRRGNSPCCEAELDTSHVITEGKWKGHGTRYCSKCHKVVYTV